MRPIVLSIAGSDPSGGAGIQADIKAIEANRGYAAAAVSAITVQNTRGVQQVEALPARLVRAQLDSVFRDLDVAAVKSGMLANAAVVVAVADGLVAAGRPLYVLDPVLRASAGQPLLDAEGLAELRERLCPLATLVTPNVAEAGQLSGIEVRNIDDAERAGRRLLDLGCVAALVKGGHLEACPGTDVLVTARGSRTFAADPLRTPHGHGIGCTYAAAIATGIARGLELEEAIERAKRFVTDALRHGLDVGGGPGPTDPFFFLNDSERKRSGPPGSAP